MKTLFDSCGQLWMHGNLRNKYVGTFFRTGSMGAGQETTAFTTLPFFAYMGMIYVTFGGKHKSLGDFTNQWRQCLGRRLVELDFNFLSNYCPSPYYPLSNREVVSSLIIFF